MAAAASRRWLKCQADFWVSVRAEVGWVSRRAGEFYDCGDEGEQGSEDGQAEVWRADGVGELGGGRAGCDEDESRADSGSDGGCEGVEEAADVEAGCGCFRIAEGTYVWVDGNLQQGEATADYKESEEEDGVGDDDGRGDEDEQAGGHGEGVRRRFRLYSRCGLRSIRRGST